MYRKAGSHFILKYFYTMMSFVVFGAPAFYIAYSALFVRYLDDDAVNVLVLSTELAIFLVLVVKIKMRCHIRYFDEEIKEKGISALEAERDFETATRYKNLWVGSKYIFIKDIKFKLHIDYRQNLIWAYTGLTRCYWKHDLDGSYDEMSRNGTKLNIELLFRDGHKYRMLVYEDHSLKSEYKLVKSQEERFDQYFNLLKQANPYVLLGYNKSFDSLPQIEKICTYEGPKNEKRRNTMPGTRNPFEDPEIQKFIRRPVAEVFATGALFDASRILRESFIKMLIARDISELNCIVRNIFMFLIEKPEAIGVAPILVDRDIIDTEITMWQVSFFKLDTGDFALLLFMPCRNTDLLARASGIIFSMNGNYDGYYYAVINENGNLPAVVVRNMAEQGLRVVGEVPGLGFQLMNGFLDCMKRDYYGQTL